MQILVEEGGWEEAKLQDISRLLENIAATFFGNFIEPPIGAVKVYHNYHGPMVLYRSPRQGDYVVLLSASGRSWSQYSFQFAHELCHIATKYEILRDSPNQWFHETLCELSSLHTLKQMSVRWKLGAAPYENWKEYSQCLEDYVRERTEDFSHQLPSGCSLSRFIQEREVELRQNPYLRDFNTCVAAQLLPIFESNCKGWQSVAYLPNSTDMIEGYLAQWAASVPAEFEPFVLEITQKISGPRLKVI